MPETHRTAEILMIEDSPADVRLTQEALEEAKFESALHVLRDGEAALEYLRDADNSLPDLVLLDLNLPKKDGREVLEAIKSDPRLSPIPVVVLTTSKAEEDVARSYRLHANCYITKPVGYARFLDVVRSIQDFWLGVVRLPPVR